MSKQCSIYVLCHPETGEVRYVGKTIQTPARRLIAHMRDARNGVNRYASSWIRSLGTSPAMRVVASVPTELAAYAERDLIAMLRAENYRLTNLTDGGEGVPGRETSAETKAKISAANRGREHTPEQRAANSAAQKGKVIPPETRQRIAATLTGIERSAETCARLSAAMKGKVRSPEHAANLGAANKGRKMSPEELAKHRGITPSPETIEKRAAAIRGRKYSAEHRAAISAGRMRGQAERLARSQDALPF